MNFNILYHEKLQYWLIVLTLALGLPLGCNSQSGLESKIQGTNIQKVERIKNKPVQDPNINPLIQKPNIQEYSEKNDKYNLNEVINDFNEVRTLVNRIYNSFTGKKLSNDLDIKILLEIEMIQRYRRLGGKGPIPKGFSNSESKKAYIKAGNIYPKADYLKMIIIDRSFLYVDLLCK